MALKVYLKLLRETLQVILVKLHDVFNKVLNGDGIHVICRRNTEWLAFSWLTNTDSHENHGSPSTSQSSGYFSTNHNQTGPKKKTPTVSIRSSPQADGTGFHYAGTTISNIPLFRFPLKPLTPPRLKYVYAIAVFLIVDPCSLSDFVCTFTDVEGHLQLMGEYICCCFFYCCFSVILYCRHCDIQGKFLSGTIKSILSYLIFKLCYD